MSSACSACVPVMDGCEAALQGCQTLDVMAAFIQECMKHGGCQYLWQGQFCFFRRWLLTSLQEQKLYEGGSNLPSVGPLVVASVLLCVAANTKNQCDI